MRNAYNILATKHEGKRRFGRPRHRQNNSNMDLKETECEGMGWLHSVQQGSMRGRAFVGQLNNYQLLKEDPPS
jgi:hypothetical protein